MGQYYKPCVLKKNFDEKTKNPVIASLKSYDFNNGAKLMEHSWVGNNFVNAAIQLIAKYKAHPFVWCGDYADTIFIDENETKYNTYDLAHTISPFELESIVEENDIEENYKYIVNYTKREYIKLPDYDETQWQVHPLPLLCADGCFRGGGDYYDGNINADMVGYWAYDRLGVTNKRPHYKRLQVEFSEND